MATGMNEHEAAIALWARLTIREVRAILTPAECAILAAWLKRGS